MPAISPELRRQLDHILDNVEVKAKASSSFTVETVNARLATLQKQLSDIHPGFSSAESEEDKVQTEIDYLQRLKAKKGWA